MPGFQEDLDADTELHINALGEASLEHIVGGPESLWARPFFLSEESSSDDNEDSSPGFSSTGEGGVVPAAAAAVTTLGGEDDWRGLSVPLMLLAARLQGAVAMGRGPAVARALTATVPPFGGEWMLPRARPVQVHLCALSAYFSSCTLDACKYSTA